MTVIGVSINLELIVINDSLTDIMVIFIYSLITFTGHLCSHHSHHRYKVSQHLFYF